MIMQWHRDVKRVRNQKGHFNFLTTQRYRQMDLTGWSDSIIAGFRDDYLYTSPVGSFPANKFGLFDMGGNVWQWCEDRFSAQNQERVLRGACWNNGPPAGIFSSSFRFHIGPGLRFNFAGFRCVIAREVRQ
jgi:formylglycine-generating enzyme required for sulfatase activity